LILSAVASRLGGMAQAGAFVGSGTMLLVGLLLWIRGRLRGAWTNRSASWTGGSILWRLALRSISRNPSRSVITIGLMAAATFLIVAMSSFRLRPTAQGVGGFELVAQSSEPIYVDLNLPQRRTEFFGSQSEVLAGSSIFGFRLRAGDDASCNNLYQASQPRILGVSPSLIEYFNQPAATSFEWGASAAQESADRSNPWRLLLPATENSSDPVPVVLDKNTAMFSLKLYRGIGEEFDFTYDGRKIRFRVAGLLINSVLQGSLLIGEENFQRHFPTLSGYRYFLVDAPAEKVDRLGSLLEDRFSDQGLDVTRSVEVLAQLLAVQNTYLSTFQSLGALGLLLGTFGLATVQLRNVLERRGELAVLRAAGYRRRRLALLVLLENVALLVGGLATGVVAALLAVLPHQFLGESAISWELLRDLGVMLLAVLAAGIASSFVSVRAVLRLPLLASLRGD
jgi:putative ABC transport system permease protein